MSSVCRALRVCALSGWAVSLWCQFAARARAGLCSLRQQLPVHESRCAPWDTGPYKALKMSGLRCSSLYAWRM